MEEKGSATPDDGEKNAFARLPDELVALIVVATGDAHAVVCFGQTCRWMHAIASDDNVWRLLCMGRFGTLPEHILPGEFGRDWKWLYRAQSPSVRVAGHDVGKIVCATSGRVYNGDLYHGLAHGYGYALWTSKEKGIRTYRGQWFSGEMHGRGVWSPACGEARDGQWVRGKVHGHCTYVWPDGSRYEGYSTGGKTNGHGVYTWPDGSCYEGDWADGQTHGRGIQRYANGRVYDGQWAHDARHGRGTQAWPSGARYEGDWVGDKRHGHGIITYSNGSIYDGEWADGAPLRSIA